MRFGRKQLSNPTPASINFWIRVYTVVAGVFMGWMQTAVFIGPKTQALMSSILGLTIALGNGVAPFFGVKQDREDIPVDKVTAAEENGNKKE